MTLRDRIRRWWSPAQWADDHPAERKERQQVKKKKLGVAFNSPAKMKLSDDVNALGPSGRTDYERDFKKPR